MFEDAARLGLKEWEFEATTARYFQQMKKAFAKENEEYWVSERLKAFWIMSPHLKKGSKPTDVIKFPWESGLKVENPFGSKEAMLEEMRKFRERTEKMEFKPVKG